MNEEAQGIDDLASQLTELHEDVLEAQLGNLAEAMGEDLSGETAPEEVDVDFIDVNAASRSPISEAAVAMGKRVFEQVSPQAYKIMCTPIGDPETQKALEKALDENYTKAAGVMAPVLASSLGLAPAVAAIVAALVVKTVSKDISGGICSAWE
ncbi:MAG: hypothetical protein ACFBSC_17135 [Microcoleaceae cyanobacterium]